MLVDVFGRGKGKVSITTLPLKRLACKLEELVSVVLVVAGRLGGGVVPLPPHSLAHVAFSI